MINPEDWVIRDMAGKTITALRGQDVEIYYRLHAREQTLNEQWYATHIVCIPETVKEWWEEPENFQAKKD